MSQFTWADVRSFLPDLLRGTEVTIRLTLLSMIVALIVGLVIALARLSRRWWLRVPATVYLEFIRGTPLLLQLFYIYYVLPVFGVKLPAFTAGVIGLSLNYGAYLSEVYRSGILAIPAGQREAAASLGMSHVLIMRRVILPQAIRIIIPPVGNYFISLFKDSALASVITIREVMRTGNLLAASTFKHFQIYTMVALIYLAISYPASLGVTWLERRLSLSTEREPGPGWRRWMFGLAAARRSEPPPKVDEPRPPVAPVRDTQIPLAPRPPRPAAPGGPLIALTDVNKSFGALRVLKHINLEIQPGEVVVILGPSGSGKSTLLRCINHLETINSGMIAVHGFNIGRTNRDGRVVRDSSKNIEAIRSEVGMVFQQFNLFPHLTVLENVIEAPTHVRKVSRAEATQRAMELLRKVGLTDKAHAYPGKLSGGQQQRVAIARALAMQPEAMLFDEVTSSLDPELTGEVLRVMRQLADEGMTMVIVTHEMGFAREVAERIIFMDDGEIVEVATPQQFFSNPRTERARAFLDAVLDQGGEVRARAD